MKFSTISLLFVLLQHGGNTSSNKKDEQKHDNGIVIVSAYTPSFIPRNIGSSSFVLQKSRRQQHQQQQWGNKNKNQLSLSSSTVFVDDTTTSKISSKNDNRSMISMLVVTSGGMEELVELTERVEKPALLSKQVRKSPALFKLAGIATIPVSAALGFSLIPGGAPNRLIVGTVGSIVSGIAGAVGKSRLDALTEANCKPALAQVLIDNGLNNIDKTQNELLYVKEQFGLSDEDYVILCTEIYSSYLIGMIKYNPIAKTTELKELENLKQILQLDNLQIGEAHTVAAKEWYRNKCLFTPEEELINDKNHPDRIAMDKFLFLTERSLKQAGETNEAFIFEMTRVAKAFNINYVTALERISNIVEPFYERALKSTRSKLDTDQVSSDMLLRARQTLGISDIVAHDMHITCFNQEVRELLGLPPKNKILDDDDEEEDDEDEETVQDDDSIDLSTARFSDEDAERLEKLQSILSLSNTDVDYELASEATPLYQATALRVMKDVMNKNKTPENAWDILEERRQDLLLNEDNSKSLLSSMIMQSLGQPLEVTNKFAKVNNEAATYDHIIDALDAKHVLIAILEKSGWIDINKFNEIFCNPWNKKSANGFLTTDERIKMYRMFLSRSILKSSTSTDGGKLSNDAYDKINEVQGLLGITDQQAEIEIRRTFGPKLQIVLREAMNEIVDDYTPELALAMKNKVNDILISYRLSDDYLRETGISYYAKAVEIISDKSPGGIPTNEMSEALESLRDLYKLTLDETYPAHMENFGSVYKKSLLEAMGTTGVIRPEFRDPLNDLRNRLGVSEENSKKLFLDAVEEKMTPMVKWVGSELERTMLSQKQLSQRRKKDMGEDMFQTGKGADGVLGLGAEVNILSDIMELVDFYIENDITEEKVTNTKKIEKTIKNDDDGDTKNIIEEEPIIETFYPITALGSNMIDQELAELLYRQLIVGSFTTQGPNAVRYENARDKFAGILGLPKQKKDEIGNTIGNTVYDNFVSNAMKTKGSMDQQDMMFLASIQGKLGLTSEEGEKLLAQAQKKILSEEIDIIMDKPTPELIKAFRDKCNTMGMDLQDDVGISKQRLARMFECEIIPGLKSGTITANDSEILGEIQESLNLDPDECETMFENVLLTLSKNCFNLAKGEIMRGREDNAVEIIKELVRYAAFTNGDLSLQVNDEALAHQIVNIYEAFDFNGVDNDTIENNKELLRTTLGI